eukprot:TRINITY_DN9751_c0_g1_i6.p1 TRINITY_DN9751_c0_g1~~TRINITY_DN9751_c0_g1_i6.p1  ORF type:complete len:104 (+),score=18.60 TRINITY_DN9751_c0_g1_i6:519-830(+)
MCHSTQVQVGCVERGMLLRQVWERFMESVRVIMNSTFYFQREVVRCENTISKLEKNQKNLEDELQESVRLNRYGTNISEHDPFEGKIKICEPNKLTHVQATLG